MPAGFRRLGCALALALTALAATTPGVAAAYVLDPRPLTVQPGQSVTIDLEIAGLGLTAFDLTIEIQPTLRFQGVLAGGQEARIFAREGDWFTRLITLPPARTSGAEPAPFAQLAFVFAAIAPGPGGFRFVNDPGAGLVSFFQTQGGRLDVSGGAGVDVVVPLPATALLLLSALSGLAIARTRPARRRKAAPPAANP
ncbi:MAG: hypothetical protein EA356_01300 [Geminicoccaceae bacterium]|nr:MAG: hypothetical protein EA356_01300 [Geminicoccaceae bacterium]